MFSSMFHSVQYSVFHSVSLEYCSLTGKSARQPCAAREYSVFHGADYSRP